MNYSEFASGSIGIAIGKQSAEKTARARLVLEENNASVLAIGFEECYDIDCKFFP